MNRERVAHVAQLEVLRRAALGVVDSTDAPVRDPAAWRHPSGELTGRRLTWPTDTGLSAWVQANMHLARTALLSCADQIAGLVVHDVAFVFTGFHVLLQTRNPSPVAFQIPPV